MQGRTFDITHPRDGWQPLHEGVRALLGERPFAVCGILPAADGGGTSPAKTKPAAKPKPTKPAPTTPVTTTMSATAAEHASLGATHTKPKKSKPVKTTPVVSIEDEVHDLKVRTAAANAQATKAANKAKSAKQLDKTPPAKKAGLLKDQAKLERQEAKVRKQARKDTKNAAPVVTTTPGMGRPGNKFAGDSDIAPHVTVTTPKPTGPSVREQITDLRDGYFETHDRWVDRDGTVYAAGVDANGSITLDRTTEVPAQGGRPAVDSEHTAVIHTSGRRRDVTVNQTRPTGDTNDVSQRSTETVDTDRNGTITHSQRRLEQTKQTKNGFIDTLRQEDYDGAGTLTRRVEGSVTNSSGGERHEQRLTTDFRADGTTPRRTTNLLSDAVDGSTHDVTTTTDLRRDGVTPKLQVIVDENEDGDANGNEPMTTTSTTDFDKQGNAHETFIERESEDGELADDQAYHELVRWNTSGDGTIYQHVTGGSAVTRDQLYDYAITGTKPEFQVSGDTFLEQATSLALDGPNYAVASIDPSKVLGGEDPVTWTRGDNDRFTASGVDTELAPPLEVSSTEVPSGFTIAASLQAAASAKQLDQSVYAKDPAKFAQLSKQQASFENQLAAATTDSQRERLMSGYFSDHDYWISRGGKHEGDTLMASAWSTGEPYSEMFGASRAMDPHATMARTGIPTTEEGGLEGTVDVVQNLYVDGSRDDIVHTSTTGPAGATHENVTGEHTNVGGVLTEQDQYDARNVSRTTEGKEPQAVTTVSSKRFNEKTGKPEGEQYSATASSDTQSTSLIERTDVYGTDGRLDDTKVENTQMSRNYDADITQNFLDTNKAVIDKASGGKDSFKVQRDSAATTVPPVGSYYTHSLTDVDYDDKGVAIHQSVAEQSITVTRPQGDDDDNGATVTTTDTTRDAGSTDGHTKIFDKAGKLVVPETTTTHIVSNEFDPTAGQAGGKHEGGHQFREITDITMGATTAPDGTRSNEWATPLQTDTLNEGFDDDWQFDRKYLQTYTSGEKFGQVIVDGDGKPKEFGKGDEVYAADGTKVVKEHDGRSEGDLDVSDHFESFMEGWGGRIVGIAAIAAGIGGAIFTGGASLALVVVGVGLAATQAVYTGINYSQGEASLKELGLSVGMIALAGLPAIQGIRTLGAGARGIEGVEDAARGAASLTEGAGAASFKSTLQRAAFSSTADKLLKYGTVAGAPLFVKGAYDGVKAAKEGDWWTAGLNLGGIVGGYAAVKGHSVYKARTAPTAPHTEVPVVETTVPAFENPTVPTTHTGPLDITTNAGVPNTPRRVTLGGGSHESQTGPNSGTRGGANGAPTEPVVATDAPAAPSSAVGGAHGAGVGHETTGPVDIDLFNNAPVYEGANGSIRGAGLDPRNAKVAPTSTDAQLFPHIEGEHASLAHVTSAEFPRRARMTPEKLGLDGTQPPIGTIVRTGEPPVYSMIMDESGTTSPVTPQGQPLEGASSTYAELAALNETSGAKEAWSVPKSQLSPDLQASLRGDGNALQRLVTESLENANGTRIDGHGSSGDIVTTWDAGRVVGIENGVEVTGLAVSWHRMPDGTMRPDTIHPTAYAATPEVASTLAHADHAPSQLLDLPDTDMVAPGVARFTAQDGREYSVFGRTFDGDVIVGDGVGNRWTIRPTKLIANNQADFVRANLPEGAPVALEGVGSAPETWTVVAHDEVAGLTTISKDGRAIRVPTADLFSSNVHRMAGDGTVRLGEIDGWTPLETRDGRVYASRVNEQGETVTADVSATDFTWTNTDAILRTAGADPTQPIRIGRSDVDSLPAYGLVEGTDYVPMDSLRMSGASGHYLFRNGYEFEHRGIYILAEGDAGAPSVATATQVNEIRAAIDRLPAYLRSTIRRVNILEGRNPDDALWAERTNSADFLSDATAADGTVNFWFGPGRSVGDTLAHEATHTFGVNGGPLNPTLWQAQMASDRAFLAQLSGDSRVVALEGHPYGLQFHGDAVSGYAQLQFDGEIGPNGLRNSNEDWAEFGRIQTYADEHGGVIGTIRRADGSAEPLTIQQAFPNRFRLFNQYRAAAEAGETPLVSATGEGAVGAPAAPSGIIGVNDVPRGGAAPKAGDHVTVRRSSGDIDSGAKAWQIVALLDGKAIVTNGKLNKTIRLDDDFYALNPQAGRPSVDIPGVQRQRDAQLAPAGYVSTPDWMTPDFLDRMGRVAIPTTQRATERGGYLPGTTVNRVAAGQALDVRTLDPSQSYLWVVDPQGNFVYAAERQRAGSLKHGNLVPANNAGGRGSARAGGELHYDANTGRWRLDNNSSYTFARLQDGYEFLGNENGWAVFSDPNGQRVYANASTGERYDGGSVREPANADNTPLRTVYALLKRSGTDLSNFDLFNVLAPSNN